MRALNGSVYSSLGLHYDVCDNAISLGLANPNPSLVLVDPTHFHSDHTFTIMHHHHSQLFPDVLYSSSHAILNAYSYSLASHSQKNRRTLRIRRISELDNVIYVIRDFSTYSVITTRKPSVNILAQETKQQTKRK